MSVEQPKQNEEKEMTYSEVVDAFNHLKFIDVTINDKLSYAVARMDSTLSSHIKRFNQAIEDINNELCSEDKQGNVLKSDKGELSFSKPNEKVRFQKIRELNEEKIKVKPFFVNPNNKRWIKLDAYIKYALDGLMWNYEEPKEEEEETPEKKS